MVDKKPTEAQIKEFWEWCGVKLDDDGSFKWWYLPDGSHLPLGEEPALDLNNLFKYAVPKVRYCDVTKIDTLNRSEEYVASVRYGEGTVGNTGYGRSKDPALALFWAIWEVIHNEG